MLSLTLPVCSSRLDSSTTRNTYSPCNKKQVLFWLFLLLVVAGGRVGFAQQELQTLHHHVRPVVASGKAAAIGTLPPDQQLNFSIILPLRNESNLSELLGHLYDPTSPEFRHFLSVTQFTKSFGPTEEDYKAVVAFARANGFTVTGTPANRLVVPLRGSVEQINKAFHLTMTEYRHPVEDRNFYSPDKEPSLGLSVPIAHISGLDNYSIPRSMLKRGDRDLKQGEKPAQVTGSGPQQSYLASDMRAAYYGGTTLDGNGQSVGILEFGGYFLSDVEETFSTAGQSYNVPIQNVLLDGASAEPEENDDDGEQVLDIVQAIGMAPGLDQVRVYIGNGSDDANVLNSMASENIAKSLSCSWSWTPADPSTDDVFFKEFAAQGQSFFAASGDDGAYDAAVDPYFYPAEDDYVTAVGGTALSTNGPGGSWVAEEAWNVPYVGSGGGISPDDIPIPAWQAGVANFLNGGSTKYRNVPDVSMEADVDNYSCDLGYCNTQSGGTSFASPRWAAFTALVNQQAVEAGTAPSGGIGFLNPGLYEIGEGSSYSVDMHDITIGNNDTYGQPVYYFAVPGYDLVTGWGSPNGQSLIDGLAGKQVPGFWIQASQSSISLLPGQSSTTTIMVTDAAGFTGSVKLAIASALPKGVTASFGTNPTSGTSELQIQASSTAPTGTSTIKITGTSGKLAAVTSLTLQVQGPAFTLSSIPASLLLNPGSSVTSTVTLNPEYGFTGIAKLSASGLPEGVTASFSPATTSATSTLTLKATALAKQAATNFTITGTSGDLVVSEQIPLLVAAPTIAFYGPTQLSMGQSSTISTYFFAYGLNGLTGNIQLSISGLPAGVTASFSPNVVTYENDQTTLTLISNGSTPFATSKLTITGTSGSITSTTTLTLNVNPPSFAIAGPQNAALGQGTISTFPMFVVGENGFGGYAKLSVSGLPTGVTASISPNPANGQTELTLSASAAAPIGVKTVTIAGTSGKLSASTTFPVGIFTPTFVVQSPGAVGIGQGAGITVPLAVTQEYGFNGLVNLSVSGLPAGVNASIAPNPTPGSTSITLISTSSAAVGTSIVTITGTSGKQTSKATFPLSINAPSFTVSSPGSHTVGQGTTLSAPIAISQEYGFVGAINLSVSGLPSGVTGVISPNPATGNSVLTLSAAASAPLETNLVTITGTSGKLTSTATFPVTVAAPAFYVQSPGNVTIGPGTTTNNINVLLNLQNGFNAPVNLAISGLPKGVSGSFSPNPAEPGGPFGQTTAITYLTLAASNSVALGSTQVTITGTSGTLTSTATFPLTVSAPAIHLSLPSGVTMGQGTTTASTFAISGENGFSGPVNLAVSGLPGGVSASISPNTVSIPSGGSSGVNSELTLTAGNSAAIGTSNLTVTATSGKITSTAAFSLSIYKPTFTVSGPGNVTIGQGTSTTASVNVNQEYGFTSGVNLAVSGLPSGVSASISPNPSTGNSQLVLTAADSAPIGTSIVTITGTSGKITSTTTFLLEVGTPAFTLTGPGTVSIGQGDSASAPVYLNPVYGFSGNANLAISGLPIGVTASFSLNPANEYSELTLTAGPSSPVGTHILTITATSGKLIQTVIFPLVIYAPTFTLSNQGSVTVGQGSSTTNNINVNPQYGFTGSVNLSVSGLPAGVAASFLFNPTSDETVLTLTAGSSASVGYSAVTVTGSSGNQKSSTTFLLGVLAPSFTISAPQGAISLGQGTSTTSYFSIQPQNGFLGSVKLSASNLPGGVSASFSPDVATGQSILTLTANNTAPVGTKTLFITGTSGAATVTTTVPLTIYQPTFTLQSNSSNASATTIGQGSSGQFNVNVIPEYGFAGDVNLAVTGLPAGVTASILPNPIVSGTTITLVASNSAPLGTYTLTITGTSGKQVQSTTAAFTIVAPTFTLSDCGSISLLPGASSTCYVDVNGANGFESSVNLAISGLPKSVTASFSPNPTPSQSTLTLTASSTAPLTTANLNITGTLGTQTSSIPLNLTVVGPSFTLYTDNPAVSVAPGASGSSTIYVNGTNGFSGNVNFSISGLPSGISAMFSPNPVASQGSTLLTLNATPTAPLGTSSLTVTGTSGTQKVTAIISLTIAAPSFSISPPGNFSVGVGSSSTFNPIIVQSSPSFSGNVQLSISGLPNGVTASFSPNPTSFLSELSLQTTNSAIPGQYPLIITGTSGSLTASTTATLFVVPPTFSINTQNQVNVGQGSSTNSSYFYIQTQNGFAGNIELSISGLPSGVTASFSSNPATSASNYSETLTFNASSKATLGEYNAIIKAVSGNLAVTTPVIVAVYSPSFTVIGESGTIVPGSSTTLSINVNPQFGFSGNVTLSASGLPTGVTASFSPNPAVNGASTLTLSASSSVVAGQYKFTVTGTSGKLSASTVDSLTIGTPSFSIFGPYDITIGQGSTASGFASINSSNTFPGNVLLGIAGLPKGITASFSPNPISGNVTSNLTLQASPSAALGQFNVTIYGKSGSQTASTPFVLTVYAPTFTLNAPYNVQIGQGTTTTATAQINPAYGFTGNVNLSVSNLPKGVTASITPNPATQQATITFTASNAAALGEYNALLTGTSGGQSSSVYFPISVFTPTFTLAQPYGTVVSQGTVTTTQIAVNPLYGFDSPITFTISGLPKGLAATFSPNPAPQAPTQSTNITLTASAALALGTYNVTVTGASGNQSSSTTFPVTINAGTFTLSVPQNTILGVGASTTVFLGYFSNNGFQGSVTYTASGLPKDVTATTAPDSTTQYASIVLTAGKNAVAGNYTFTITGTSGSQSSSVSVPLSIVTPTFLLLDQDYYDGNPINIGQGQSDTTIIVVDPEFGFTGNVTLAATSLPTGVTASFSPNPTSTNSTLTLTAANTAPLGTQWVGVTGNSGSQTASINFPITVEQPTFYLGGIYGVTMAQGTSQSNEVFVNPEYGFNGQVTFTISGLPSGVTASFSPNPATQNTQLTLVASSAAAVGNYSVTVTGTSGSQSAPLNFNLSIAVATQ